MTIDQQKTLKEIKENVAFQALAKTMHDVEINSDAYTQSIGVFRVKPQYTRELVNLAFFNEDPISEWYWTKGLKHVKDSGGVLKPPLHLLKRSRQRSVDKEALRHVAERLTQAGVTIQLLASGSHQALDPLTGEVLTIPNAARLQPIKESYKQFKKSLPPGTKNKINKQRFHRLAGLLANKPIESFACADTSAKKNGRDNFEDLRSFAETLAIIAPEKNGGEMKQRLLLLIDKTEAFFRDEFPNGKHINDHGTHDPNDKSKSCANHSFPYMYASSVPSSSRKSRSESGDSKSINLEEETGGYNSSGSRPYLNPEQEKIDEAEYDRVCRMCNLVPNLCQLLRDMVSNIADSATLPNDPDTKQSLG